MSINEIFWPAFLTQFVLLVDFLSTTLNMDKVKLRYDQLLRVNDGERAKENVKAKIIECQIIWSISIQNTSS